jgi:LDH2 family malate/lactate/ureidoglycolate dehydrogenase
MAGHKGYALAMLVEILSGVLSGSAVGSGIGSMYKDMNREQNVGHFFCLFDISSFMDVSLFKERIGSMIDLIKVGRKQPGTDEIFVPGERTNKKVLENKEMGIPIDTATLEELRSLCHKRGVPFTLS